MKRRNTFDAAAIQAARESYWRDCLGLKSTNVNYGDASWGRPPDPSESYQQMRRSILYPSRPSRYLPTLRAIEQEDRKKKPQK